VILKLVLGTFAVRPNAEPKNFWRSCQFADFDVVGKGRLERGVDFAVLTVAERGARVVGGF